MTGLVATAEVEIAADRTAVWRALTDPAMIKQYFMGTDVETDWEVGSPITWSGEYQGNAFQDKGTVVEVEPEQRLVLTHYSPMSGQPDEPSSYHTLTYELSDAGGLTRLSLSQDNNGSDDEVEHATQVWASMLTELKQTVEGA